MELVNLFMNVAMFITLLMVGVELRDLREEFRLTRYESDIPEDIRHYLEGRHD